ncbi:MAG: chorismate mutase, partial [Candidatus Korarchaeota archaeon]|nr:chorismate mutase [Candidatus Korarchaeota archaeon]
MGEISELRGRIDGIDREILRLLDERTRRVRESGRIKRRRGLSVRDPERGRHIIERAGEHGRVCEG